MYFTLTIIVPAGNKLSFDGFFQLFLWKGIFSSHGCLKSGNLSENAIYLIIIWITTLLDLTIINYTCLRNKINQDADKDIASLISIENEAEICLVLFHFSSE